MFTPHQNICKECGHNTLIVVKAMLCGPCNHKLKQSKKKSAGKKISGYKYTKEPTGEKDVFHAVLDNLDEFETRCFVCKVRVPVVTHHNMAHILSKGKYPLFRLNPDNIKILCHRFIADENGFQGCHFSYDMKPHSELKGEGWERLFKLREDLKQEYKQLESRNNE